MKTKKRYSIQTMLAALLVLATLTACGKGGGESSSHISSAPPEISEPPSSAPESTLSEAAQGQVIVSFPYAEQSGYATNQFAVWVEDESGALVKTLYVTEFTAKGGYENRPDSIPLWVEKARPGDRAEGEVDAMTGATPKAGTLAYEWDLTDGRGEPVPAGVYTFCVEGSLRWKNRVLYTGTIAVGDEPSSGEASAQFFYEGEQDQPALAEDAPETAMIGPVTARYTPAAS